MRYKTRFWDDKKKIKYTQENNVIETYNKIIRPGESYYESCGPTSLAIAAQAKYLLSIMRLPGGWIAEYDDLFFDFFNHKNNKKLFHVVYDNKDKFPPNRYLGYYPIALQKTTGIKSKYHKTIKWTDIVKFLKNKNPLILYMNKPYGHYVCAGAYDDEKNIVELVNPWSNMPGNKRNGWHEKLTEDYFNTNYHKECLEVL